MNIHFPQTERKSHLVSQLLVAVIAFILLIVALRVSHGVEIKFSVPSISIQAVQPANSDVPVAIPVPLPPAEQPQAIVTPEAAGNATSILVPQAIPAPAPSVP